MNKKILPLVIIGIFSLSALAGCSGEKEVSKEVPVGTNVSVYKVKKDNIASTVIYTGTLAPEESVSISSKVGATALDVAVSEGDYVSAGQVLLSLDKTDLQNAYRQAQASYNQASMNYNREQNLYANQSNIKLAQQGYNDAKNAYDRVKKLFDMGGASQVELDGAYTALVNAEENLKTVNATSTAASDSALAMLESAKISLDMAMNNLNNATVTAPISGYVSKCSVSRGQLVSPGVEIFRVSDTRTVNAEINVTESVIPYMEVGGEATVNISSAKLDKVKGTITGVNPVKDQMTGLYNVKISIDNTDDKIKAGMLCDVELVLSKLEDIIKVPSEALINSGDDYFVYIAEGNRAKKVKVDIGITDETYTEIISGLDVGNQVIVSGKDYLSEKNNEIRITEE